MKKILASTLIAFFSFGLFNIVLADDIKITQILNTATIEKDPGIKVLELNFKKTSSEDYSEKWESYIKLKSCYSIKMQCDVTGNFYSENGEYRRYGYSTLFFGFIEKKDTVEKNAIISINPKYINEIESFEMVIKCNPIYSEHPNYPPNHKYWKQFLPKNNECR